MSQLKYATSPLIRKSESFIMARSLLVGSPGEYDHLRSAEAGFPLQSRFSISRVSSPIKILLNIVILLSFLTGLAIFTPEIIYAVFPPSTVVLEPDYEQSVRGGKFSEGAENSKRRSLPPLNENLPKENWLEIPVIGVLGELHESEDQTEALDKGIWLDPKYGRPDGGSGASGDSEMPVMIGAHRFGWKWWWKDDYWKYNSFYNLPDTKPGDIVEITYDQRKYRYEIYLAEEGLEVTDLNADLILYTCKHLNSPVKYFRYGRLLS